MPAERREIGPTVTILGVRVDKLTREQALRRVDTWEGDCMRILFVNAHTLNLTVGDPRLLDALHRSDLVLNDGIGLSLAARMRGERFPENLNGSDFTMCLLDLAASRQWRVFLLGGKPGIAEAAARRLTERVPRLRVVGTCHGFTGADDRALAERVRRARADVLLVAFGNPLQEVWLDRYLEATGARIGAGVGAFLDFSTGSVRRAPLWMNRLGIEWCFRLLQEPKRLWRRYLLGNPVFLARAWKARN
jgi:exopolysaccharide biosynthesis WecB/TagA/CpsF family protein